MTYVLSKTNILFNTPVYRQMLIHGYKFCVLSKGIKGVIQASEIKYSCQMKEQDNYDNHKQNKEQRNKKRV